MLNQCFLYTDSPGTKNSPKIAVPHSDLSARFAEPALRRNVGKGWQKMSCSGYSYRLIDEYCSHCWNLVGCMRYLDW